jgi:hypothetical protein
MPPRRIEQPVDRPLEGVELDRLHLRHARDCSRWRLFAEQLRVSLHRRLTAQNSPPCIAHANPALVPF